ncbi:MAG: DUF4215 domain-containing protein [Candidatus Peribacteraceae bacterium]|jgi:cysteine-rich repeat protein
MFRPRAALALGILLAMGLPGAWKAVFRPAVPHASAAVCLAEGREGSTRSWQQLSCCEGLRALKKSARVQNGWGCKVAEADEEKIVCTKCGDGVCGRGETSCNCSKDCRIPWKCGNGRPDGNEACDDKNRKVGDGCSERCTVEEGWSCRGSPSECAARCGDGVVTANEQCDDSNRKSRDGCSSQCVVETGWSCEGGPSRCTAAGALPATGMVLCLGREDGAVVVLDEGCAACSCYGGGVRSCTRLPCTQQFAF